MIKVIKTSSFKQSIIKRKRLEKGMSIIELSKRLGLPMLLYWYYENHMQYITNDMIKKIFDEINVKYEVAV